MAAPKSWALDKTISSSGDSASSFPTSHDDLHAPGSSPPSVSLQPGVLLGQRYLILTLLGEGGMGAVYKAHDKTLGRDIALKVIRPDFAANAEVLHRFKQEIILARQVTHRNVVRIFDIGEADGIQFITMEYVEGETLRERLKQSGRLPPGEAVAIMRQMLAGLGVVHEQGILHRDLKPGNVMVDPSGRLVLMDFGLARAVQSDGMTQSGAVIGTMEYMSPEQATGSQLDARSDLFTAGLMFYEMLTGVRPYEAESAIASLVRRTRERATPASDIERTVPRGLSKIVSRCLETEKAERYASAAAVLHDLDVYEGVSVALPAPARATRKPIWLTAVTAGILLLTVAAWFGYRRWQGPAAPASSPQRVSVLVADFANTTSEEVFDGTLEPALTIALEGAKFINSFSRTQARKVGTSVKPGAAILDEEVARLVAIREGITVVVSGTIQREGAAYSITARTLDAVTGKVLGEARASAASKDEVLGEVGRLAAGIRQSLGDSTPESTQLAAAETFTAASLDAAHAYASAQELQGSGKWDQAIAQYQRAIEADPDLGRAYSGLAVVYANLGQRQKAEEFYQQALARVHRMTNREKFRTRGAYYLMVRQPRKAVEEFNALLAEFPHDEAALSNLALSHFYLREMDKAIEHGQRAVEDSGNGLRQRTNLALYALYAGDYRLAERSATEILRSNPDFPIAHLALGMAQVGKGEPAKAIESYEKLENLGPHGASLARLGLADLKLYQGRILEAIPLLEQALTADLAAGDNSNAAVKLVTLAGAHSLTGNRGKALAAADRALQLDQSDAVSYAAGRVYIDQRQDARALKLATRMAARIEMEPQIYGKLVEGEVHLARGDAQRALAIFQDAQRLADTWLGRVNLGRAYLAAGAFTEASSEFEVALRRSGEASAVFLDDLPTFRYLPAVYYDLGRAQEGLNSPAARESFSKFLDIKKDGDQVGLVADARRRVAAR